MSGNIAPCKGCPYREVGCHGKCEVYREWLARRRKQLNAVKTQAEVNDYEKRNRFFRQDGPKGRKGR